MAVKRQENFLAQQRIDVPHLKAIESAVAADFDALVGRGMAGDRALVVRGLNVAGIANLVAAKALSVVVADSLVVNVNADQAGSFLWTEPSRAAEVLDPNTNSRVEGGWTPSATNYVGIDFVRAADASTTDLVQFMVSNTGLESPRQVPLAKTLDYRLVISTLPFSTNANIIPICRVTLNSDSKVTEIKDARPLMFRLGSGGDNPDPGNSYGAWTRAEVLGSITSSEFQGGDKGIGSLKDWQDAVMTRLWEIGGGEFWYSATADRNLRLITHDSPGVSGEYFVWNSGTAELTWQNLRVLFDNSTAYSNDVADGTMTDFQAGDCLYVDLDRTQFYAPTWVTLTVYAKGDLVIQSGKAYQVTVAGTSGAAGPAPSTGTAIVDGTVTWKYVGVGTAGGLVPVKAQLSQLGVGATPGSRFVLAWRQSDEVFTRDWRYPLGTLFPAATTATTGSVKLSRTASTPAAPIVISDTGGAISATGNNVGLTISAAGTGKGLVVNGGTGDGAEFNAGSGGNKNGATAVATGEGFGFWGNASGAAATVNAAGVYGYGGANIASGVIGESGVNGGYGGWFKGHGSAAAVMATNNGAGPGVQGTGANAATGHGVTGEASHADAAAGSFEHTVPTAVALRALVGLSDLRKIDVKVGAGVPITVGGNATSIIFNSLLNSTLDIQTANSKDFIYSGNRFQASTASPIEMALISNCTYNSGTSTSGPHITHTAIGSAVVFHARVLIPEGASVREVRLLYNNSSGGPVTVTADAGISTWTSSAGPTNASILNGGTVAVADVTSGVSGAFAAHTNQTMPYTGSTVGAGNTVNNYMWVKVSVPAIAGGVFNVYGVKVSYLLTALRPST